MVHPDAQPEARAGGPESGPAGARVVLTTAPDAAQAEQLARGLLQRRLAACVQLVQGVTSLYHWEGSIAREGEVLLFAKTVGEHVPAIEVFLDGHHPYDVPEMIVLSADYVAPSYRAWLVDETARPPA